MSRHEQTRSFRRIDLKHNIKRNRSNRDIQPLMEKSWQILESDEHPKVQSRRSRYCEEENSEPSYHRRQYTHPYSSYKRHHAPERTTGIPSLLSINIEIEPPSLFSPGELEHLQTAYSYSSQKSDKAEEDSEDEYVENLYESGPMECNMNRYLNEEPDAKQKIDEIIMVAQALREKLERGEELRQTTEVYGHDEDYDCERRLRDSESESSENFVSMPSGNIESDFNSTLSIPRLMDLKPGIPSLMDLRVSPPPIEDLVQENIIMATNQYEITPRSPDTCWNCDQPGHRFVACTKPRMSKFCFRCGRPGFSTKSCPSCIIQLSLN